MLKRRGGQKQRSKENDVWNDHRDPNRGGSGMAVIRLEKLGWEQGKGLGDGWIAEYRKISQNIPRYPKISQNIAEYKKYPKVPEYSII